MYSHHNDIFGYLKLLLRLHFSANKLLQTFFKVGLYFEKS